MRLCSKIISINLIENHSVFIASTQHLFTKSRKKLFCHPICSHLLASNGENVAQSTPREPASEPRSSVCNLLCARVFYYFSASALIYLGVYEEEHCLSRNGLQQQLENRQSIGFLFACVDICSRVVIFIIISTAGQQHSISLENKCVRTGLI